MNFLKIAGHDIKNILKNKFIAIAIAAIIIIPIVYSIFYLAAFWDPYGNTCKMPVAVVNLDKGSVNDGKNVNYGNDIVDKLKNNTKAKWCFVSYDKAEEGLKGKDYYAEFVIPEDFSKKVLKVKDGKPDKGIIIYKSDSRKNYLASIITDKALEKIETEISNNIAEEFTKLTFDKMYEIKDNLHKAADGSGKLHDGINTLSGKIPELENGVTKLKDGSQLLTSKLGEAKAGSIMLNNGVKEAESKLNKQIEEFNNNPALQGLLSQVDNNKLKLMKEMLAQSVEFKNKDLSMLNTAKAVMKKENINSLKKTAYDFKALDVQKLLNDPSLQLLKKLDNEENIKNAQKLINDVDALQNIDMKKVSSLLGALNGTDKLLNLAKSTEKLCGNINANEDKIKTLEQLMMDPSMDKYITSAVKLNSKYENLQKLLGGKTEIKPEDLGKIDVNLLLKYINDMSNDAKDLQEASKKIQQLGPEKIYGGVSYVKTLVPQIQALKTELDKNKETINNVHNSLTPENINYIKVLVPKLLTIKSDLDKNANNLNAMRMLVLKASDPKTKEIMKKIVVLQKDIEDIKPLIENLDKQITEKNMSNLQQAPALIDKVQGMQKKFKENEKIISLANEALNEGNVEMAQKLIAAVPTLKDGMKKLSDGSSKLSDGLGKLQEGSNALTNGLNTMNGKMPELKDGVTKLNDGSKELNDKLSDGAKKLDKNLKNTSDEMGEFVSNPVETQNKSINVVPNYGSGFAPYFISLALWVGAMMMFFIIENRVNKKFEETSTIAQVTGKFVVYGIVGVLQAVCVSAAIMKLGLKPQSTLWFFGFNIILSLVFICIMQCLIALLGDVGRFIAMVFLILQLTSSAGTYPIETLPKLFRVLYPYMPFTYAIQGLREIIAGSNWSIVGHDVFILTSIAIVFFIILVIFKKKGDKVQEFMESVKEEMA